MAQTTGPELISRIWYESHALAEDIRQLLYARRRSRYRILFRIRGDTVEIVHVRHGARQPLGR